MNFAMFFSSDGKAIHQYHGILPLAVVRAAKSGVSDWFGSHGCVRLTEEDAKTLFDWTPIGTPVDIR
jgi:lipoprotein-anchoring transpeptidase ErfK/SrfK